MSLLERARAFAAVAPHLPESKRAEVADALAAEIMPKLTGRRSGAGAGQIIALDDHRDHEPGQTHPVVGFLLEQGVKGPDLARFTGRMAATLKTPWIEMYVTPPTAEQLQAAYAEVASA